MRTIYRIAADVLRALGWEVEINEKDSYWNLVLSNTTSSEDMPESHKAGHWLMHKSDAVKDGTIKNQYCLKHYTARMAWEHLRKAEKNQREANI